MDNNRNHRRRRISSGVATMLIAAGAVVVAQVGMATPAAANVDTYVAIAFSAYNDTGAIVGDAPSLQTAETGAVSKCDKKGGNHCVVVASAKNSCAAMAITEENSGKVDAVAGASGPTRFIAEQLALAKNHGGFVLGSQCSSDAN
jgi:hypothetical protein